LKNIGHLSNYYTIEDLLILRLGPLNILVGVLSVAYLGFPAPGDKVSFGQARRQRGEDGGKWSPQFRKLHQQVSG